MPLTVDPNSAPNYPHHSNDDDDDFEMVTPKHERCDFPETPKPPTDLAEGIAISRQATPPRLNPMEMSEPVVLKTPPAPPTPALRPVVKKNGCWASFKRFCSKCFCCCPKKN